MNITKSTELTNWYIFGMVSKEMTECLFCKIAGHEVPVVIRYEDDLVIAFDDIHPAAPVHVVIVPKKHITGLEAIGDDDHREIMGVFQAVQKLAENLNLGGQYKLVVNGPDLRHIDHLHFHLLNRKIDTE